MKSNPGRSVSLPALRSLVQVGHCASLAEAAQQLHLTASALSHQMSRLEEEIGVRLFERTGRALSLTTTGKRLHANASAIFARLDDAIAEARRAVAAVTLRVSCPPTFGSRWLIPRLSSFQAQYPDIDLQISTSTSADYTSSNCAILFGEGNWRAQNVEFLRQETLMVVCAPAYKPAAAIDTPAELQAERLLVARLRQQDWEIWASAAGCHVDAARYLTLATRNMVIDAAVKGLGIAVVDPVMVGSELANGTLKPLFDVTCDGAGAYYFVHEKTETAGDAVDKFRHWIVAGIEDTSAGAPEPDV
ncbi:LysR family glycine cleavage system transcriptional activator [Paraburkholderia sp. GV068]|uniref:LysR substrate-binding domain-containing protein n=1 Tax=Paraburkholderia TaxID=1822464 RepID=UPI000D3281BA|nr:MULTISPECIES: LysR substrate-binding domain-containing protein [unclassified Paraburkholderia]PTQ92094.1 LysR family glycine cleavage system transcriptional activator [Paraburkholderia sp. GV072]PUA94304.1 LysR family glycine cleavage system transcriptional activator [Paraburkholderia sp. GV068]